MEKICKVIKKLILAPFIIYLYNVVASPINLIIPINIYTVMIVGVLGIPGLVTLMIYLMTF